MGRLSSKRGSRGKEESSSRSSKRSSKKEVNFINLGTLSLPKSLSEDKLANELADDMMDSEFKVNLKVYLGKDAEAIEIRTGDIIMIKFKEYEGDKDWSVGKAFLIAE